MRRTLLIVLALAGTTALSAPAEGPSLTKLADVGFRGEVEGPDDISGAAAVGDFLVVVSDEVKDPTVVQVLKKDGAGYKVVGGVKLPAGKHEVDLEAAAADGETAYVTGSHA